MSLSPQDLFVAAAAAALCACTTIPTEPFAAIGAEFQAYPAGVISSAHLQLPIDEDEVAIVRFGYNRTDRGDFGEHDNEEGGGLGGGFGYRRYFGQAHDCWFLGGRLDAWQLDIDWRDDNPTRRGSTDTIVLMPTIEGGYAFILADHLRLELNLGLGFEFNVSEDGEDVGDGAILLIGINLLQVF